MIRRPAATALAVLLLALWPGIGAGQPAPREMKVFISVDMEGLTGVVQPQQLGPAGFEYGRFREIMTGAPAWNSPDDGRSAAWRSPARTVNGRSGSDATGRGRRCRWGGAPFRPEGDAARDGEDRGTVAMSPARVSVAGTIEG